jgi:IclR family transcriptional regulator, KDG regulon repressor
MSSDNHPAAPGSGRPRGGHVGSVLKAAQLVEALAGREGDVSLGELARATGQPVASTYRMVMTLEHAGWMVRGDEGGYRLSLRLAQVASGALSGGGMRAKARPIMARLTAQTGETSYLALRDGDHVTCLERVESSTLVRLMTWDVGKTLPLNRGAASLALLAHLTGQEASLAAARLGGAPEGAGEHEARDGDLAARLARIRQDGYSVSIEEVTPGVASVGAAIFDASAEVTGAVSVGGLAPSIRDRITEIAPAVRSAAESISRMLGYAGGYPPPCPEPAAP